MEDPRIQELLDKYAADACSPEERAELYRWYDAFPQSGAPEGKAACHQEARRAVLGAIAEAQPRRRRRARALGAAAAVAALACCAWWGMKGRFTEPAMVEVRVPAGGGIRTVQLPDGSRAWLSAGSTMRYREGFAGGGREVWLPDGQVFFDVGPITEQPFTVKTARGVVVKVLGTEFSVTAWPELPQTEVYVASGSVQVSDGAGAPEVLKTRESIALAEGKPARKQAGNRPDPRSGACLLSNADFATVAAFVKRRFGFEVRYDPVAMQAVRFNVFAEKDMTAPAFFELLRSVSGMPFRVEGNTVTFFAS